MKLEEAILLLQKAVKFTGTIDQKHIDLTVVPAQDREIYERALAVGQLSITSGAITKDEFLRRVHLDS